METVERSGAPLMAVAFHKQAAGAIRNGTPIVKVEAAPDDTKPNGARGVVVGSVDVSPLKVPKGTRRCNYAYFVQFDDDGLNGAPLAVMDSKLAVSQ